MPRTTTTNLVARARVASPWRTPWTRAVAALGLVAGGLLASTGCGRDNVTACRDAVAAQNAAREACDDPLRIDEDEACPASLNQGADCTEYYDRIADSAMCERDGTVTIDATGDCT